MDWLVTKMRCQSSNQYSFTGKYFQLTLEYFTTVCSSKGLSIRYVMLFLANFDPPPPCHTLSHIPGPPLKVRHASRPPPIFFRPSTKISDKSPLYKFYLNCSLRFYPGVLSELVFGRSPFCHNTSVKTES